MSILGPYVHHLDPIIGTILGVHLWWYGLSYSLGFLNAFLFIQRRRGQMDLSLRSVYNLSLLLAIGALLGGRFVEVVFYELPFYREHLHLIPAYWLGGMATHGVLFGGLIGILVFARLHGRSFLEVTDALAIPGTILMAAGRLGNFIDGQIVGSITTVPWAVKFPDAEGFRHPVVLYDAMKNLLIVPILMYAEKRQAPQGMRTGIALFLYAFLRIFVDLLREYPTTLLGMATGQVLNILLSIFGLGLIIIPLRRSRGGTKAAMQCKVYPHEDFASAGLHWQLLAFTAILLFALIIPSDSTQDVPSRYGKRHAGLSYSCMYPKIDASHMLNPPKID